MASSEHSQQHQPTATSATNLSNASQIQSTHNHVNGATNNDSNSSDDPEIPEIADPAIHKSPNDVFLSLRNTANKIARSGTRKLRHLSTKKTSQLSIKKPINNNNNTPSEEYTTPPTQTNHDHDHHHNHTPTDPKTASNKKKLDFSKIKLNTPFFKRTHSKSNPSTPTYAENKKNAFHFPSHPTPPRKSNIVIGATYSHSDNELVDHTLQTLHKRRKEIQQKKKRFIKKRKKKTPSDDMSIDYNHSQPQHPQTAQNTQISDAVEEKSNSNNISFQFLKNVDLTRMNHILSHSSQTFNTFMNKQKNKVINKTTPQKVKQKHKTKHKKAKQNCLKHVPQNSLELWKKNQEYELNRFARMSSQASYRPFHGQSSEEDYFDCTECILWEKRIMTDLIRAGKLFVCGEVDEIFEFPSFKCTQEKQELVRTTIRYLESAVQETITSLLAHKSCSKHKKLNADAAREISVKCVRQALISLCQEFVNDPYFAYLKQSCELFNLQPTDIGLIGSQEVSSIKSWTPRLCINITGNRIYTHIVRVFQCYELNGIEAIETQIYFGFKRTYSVDCLGGPPVILPPIFLAHDKGKEVAYQISIPKEKVLDSIYLDNVIPTAEDFIPTKD